MDFTEWVPGSGGATIALRVPLGGAGGVLRVPAGGADDGVGRVLAVDARITGWRELVPELRSEGICERERLAEEETLEETVLLVEECRPVIEDLV